MEGLDARVATQLAALCAAAVISGAAAAKALLPVATRRLASATRSSLARALTTRRARMRARVRDASTALLGRLPA